MTKKQDLKFLAGTQIIESKLSNMAKKQLLIFIKEEKDEHVLKSFILDSKIISCNLDEHSRDIIDDRFLASEAGGRVAQTRKTGFSIAGLPFSFGAGSYAAGAATGAMAPGAAAGAGVFATMAAGAAAGVALWALYRKVRATFDKCSKKCGTYKLNTIDRQNCMSQCKVEKIKSEINIVNKKKCKLEKNPNKCEEKKKAALLNLNYKLKNLERTIAKQKSGDITRKSPGKKITFM